ncbi:serine hydrolase domain-containing protein [Pricia sp. S334]|uniref:Serine hydrolase domain-containing protein n=1 Tax=Pricia mediterranea TaxID=3076079 RepID=A0ABU3L3M4_9FLAO|nr:serine hydrolase domain-containing protein [Pricia sp. S334]MDT7827697.1 serine hydrolase domain-containing protein [Pricia sp. S334]
MKNILYVIIYITALFTRPLAAQDGSDIESTSVAIEQMLDQTDDASIVQFVETYIIKVEDPQTFIEKIENIRKELRGIRDDIGLDLDEAGAILTFGSEDVEKRLRIEYSNESNKITDLFILPPEQKLKFEINDLNAAIQFMKDQDMAGLLYLKSNGKVVIEEPFGMSNENLGVANTTETIFAIGSRPIDFTTAAILLLDQQDILSLDDSIEEHLVDVPADKKGITIKHLMSGESGLPDFFDMVGDWDADLQWISRNEAILRMMNQDLLFEPGQGNSHSHGAFGLLAAIVELTTGKTYMDYLKENFFSPAGMTRTGEYGDAKDFEIKEFAVGGGPQLVGLPNIPPNWGPTSWLVKGSGGMYSTLDDLLKFYSLVRSGKVFDDAHVKYFKEPSADVDGSMRGFELFSVYNSPQSELYLFLNSPGDNDVRRKIFRALEELID